MNRLGHRNHRGLSLLELLLAMSITVMVAAAIAGMLGAVSTGVGTRHDTRTVMVLANAAESRLSAYIAPSRCILDADGSDLVLWFNDARGGETVHATEIRWVLFDAASGTLDVHYVTFPDEWSQTAKDLEDSEYASNTNWMLVLADYQTSGWVSRQPLIERLASGAVRVDEATAMTSRHMNYELGFQTESGPMPITVAATIRLHAQPKN